MYVCVYEKSRSRTEGWTHPFVDDIVSLTLFRNRPNVSENLWPNRIRWTFQDGLLFTRWATIYKVGYYLKVAAQVTKRTDQSGGVVTVKILTAFTPFSSSRVVGGRGSGPEKFFEALGFRRSKVDNEMSKKFGAGRIA